MNKSGKFLFAADQKEADDDFSRVIGDVTPLSPHGRYMHPAIRRSSLPLSRLRDEREVILESMTDPIHSYEDVELDGDAAFVRPGLSRQILRRLRRGEWLIQAELDLHGLTKAEAKIELAEFLHECKHQRLRCVRVIHGKGLRSPNREPVLKLHVRHWLTQRDEILAFVTARPVDGGGGATVVLLKGR